MTTNFVPQVLTATVSEDYLKRSTRYFNSSIRDILIELTQNSRRAGATNIRLAYSYQECFFELADDGKGIDDPRVLLTLGKSAWDEKIQQKEDPAGTGVFSLAACEKVYVWSKNWFLELTPEVFTEQQTAVVREVQQAPIQGTIIRFYVSAEQFNDFVRRDGNVLADANRIKTQVGSAIPYYPLPINIHDLVHNKKDILKPTNFLSEKKCFYSEYWNGLQIGVCVSHDAFINFYGIVLSLGAHPFAYIQDTANKYFNVAINVVDCDKLSLVLPARKEVVKDEFYYQLAEYCKTVIYRGIFSLPSHHLSYLKYKEAQSLLGDESLKEAAPVLKTFVPKNKNFSNDREYLDIPKIGQFTDYLESRWEEHEVKPDSWVCDEREKCFLCDVDDQSPEGLLLWRAWQTNNEAMDIEDDNLILLIRKSDFNGYLWYEDLPVVDYILCEASINNEWVPIENCDADIIVDKLRLVVLITGGEEEKTKYFPTDIYFDDSNIWISEEFNPDIDVITSLLFHQRYEYCDYTDAGTETQEGNAWRKYKEAVKRVILDPNDALKEAIESRLDEIIGLVDKEQKVTITITRNSNYVQKTDIQIEPFKE